MTDKIQNLRPVQEDELHAYVDDRLDAGRRCDVERLLAEDAAMRERVAVWQHQRDLLRAAVAFRHREPVPPALGVATIAEARLHAATRIDGWRFAAGIVLALSLGATGGWLAHGPRNPSEIARLSLEATSAFRTFANDVSGATEISTDSRPMLANWMTVKLGRQVVVPDLSAAGYRLLGGRMLAVMYGPAAMLVYEDTNKNRISVYIQPMRRGEEAPMQSLGEGAVDGYAWINRQIGFSVMSEGDRDRLHAIANQVRDGMRL